MYGKRDKQLVDGADGSNGLATVVQARLVGLIRWRVRAGGHDAADNNDNHQQEEHNSHLPEKPRFLSQGLTGGSPLGELTPLMVDKFPMRRPPHKAMTHKAVGTPAGWDANANHRVRGRERTGEPFYWLASPSRETQCGAVIKEEGDAFFLAFRARAGVIAFALDSQEQSDAYGWRLADGEVRHAIQPLSGPTTTDPRVPGCDGEERHYRPGMGPLRLELLAAWAM